jgi:hypothetical protein
MPCISLQSRRLPWLMVHSCGWLFTRVADSSLVWLMVHSCGWWFTRVADGSLVWLMLHSRGWCFTREADCSLVWLMVPSCACIIRAGDLQQSDLLPVRLWWTAHLGSYERIWLLMIRVAIASDDWWLMHVERMMAHFLFDRWRIRHSVSEDGFVWLVAVYEDKHSLLLYTLQYAGSFIEFNPSFNE